MSASKEDSGGMAFLDTRMNRWVTIYLPIALFLFVLLFPFYWMGITAFKPNEQLLSREGNPFWVINPTLAHITNLNFVTFYHKPTIAAARYKCVHVFSAA